MIIILILQGFNSVSVLSHGETECNLHTQRYDIPYFSGHSNSEF